MTRPKRVDATAYVGVSRYFLTFCTRNRQQLFWCEEIAETTLQQIRRAACAEKYAILAYCLMPDHVHLLVEGLAADCDLRRFTKRAKQHSGAAHALRYGTRLWQAGYCDRVLRKDTDAREVARYILWNPVRAGIAKDPATYPHLGSDTWPIHELLT